MDCEESSHSVNIICSETVRYSFVSHLTGALCRQGISVSVFADTDGRELEDDQNQGPRVSVVIFSETYTSSIPWFVKLLEHHKKNGYTIVPVFYGVDPSVVNRNLECLKTLPRAENLTGHQSSDSELVEEIVRDVYGKLSPTERIGIYSRLLEIENLLCDQPWGIRSLGIWGMPGIGKTTLAKAVFEQMSNDYDASCFIEDFDEALYKAGPHRLLEENIFKIVIEKFGISSCYITRLSLLRDKLCDTRILLVLDDVRNPLVAESFLGKLNWFGPGSLIIITSRYKQVFALCHVNQIYKVEGLNEHDALQLFSRTAFEEDLPEQNDTELSMKVIDYANGNPLALRIYGQKLKGKKSEMETTFLKLKQCPPQKIQDRLQSVYSALGDNEKYIFLDIACFFKGENVDYVVQMLNGCGYFPRIGIDVLVEKCLVTISENTLQINDLVQYIIREIIVGERIQMKKCTTLWQPSSIRYLLEDDELKADDEPKATPKRAMVAEDIEGISLDTSNLIFDVNPDAFKNMLSLRFLKIYNSNSENVLGLNFPKGLNSLPCKLRLLLWENYPFESLPQGFDLRELVELNMPCSQLKKLRTRTKNLGMLKRIKLCHSQQLIEFDLTLDAKYIEIIDLQGCTRLQSFPDTSELQHLRVVNLTGCTEIKSFQGAPPNIEELHLQGTSISEIPISIVSHYPQNVKLDRQKLLNLIENFHDVEHIDLESITDLVKVSSSSQGFGKLVHLNMKNCSHLQSLPDMASLESLEVLLLSGCSKLEKIKRFPRNMKKLYLGGTAVREVPQLPQSLELLNAHGCKNLESVSIDFGQLPRHYIFSNCFNFPPQVIAEFLEKDLTRVASLAGANQQELIKASEVSICIPLGACQNSYLLLQEGPNVSIDIAPWTQKPISGFAKTVVVSFRDDYHNTVGLGIRCICTWKTRNGYSKRTERLFQCWAATEAPNVDWDHIFIFYDTEMHPSDEENPNLWADEVKFEFHTVSWENKLLGANCMVTLCGVEIITAPTDDTIQGEITLESEATSVIEEHPQITIESEATNVIEEHPPTSSRIIREAKSLNSVSSSEQRKVSSVQGKLISMGTMLWKWMKTIRRVDIHKKYLMNYEFNTSCLPRRKEAQREEECAIIARRLTKHEQVDSKPASTSPPPLSNSFESHFDGGQCFTLRDLEIATNRFSEKNVIDESYYGVVYRGELINGTPVAVRNILIMSDQGKEELISKVNAIGYVRHKNIVSLLGYCIEGPHRILVYEYVSNGNLKKWLHGEKRQHGCFTWEARMKILIGTSKALAHLHEASEPKVVHGDIKPSNILINDEFEAKVSNFGLSELFCTAESHVRTRVMGRIGYAAPEYVATGRLNENTDVYSFGVVVLEAITGRKPKDLPVRKANLVEWLKKMVGRRRLEKLVDPDIEVRPHASSLTRALFVALRCLDPDSDKRPKMSQVVAMFESKYSRRITRRETRALLKDAESHIISSNEGF